MLIVFFPAGIVGVLALVNCSSETRTVPYTCQSSQLFFGNLGPDRSPTNSYLVTSVPASSNYLLPISHCHTLLCSGHLPEPLTPKIYLPVPLFVACYDAFLSARLKACLHTHLEAIHVLLLSSNV